MTDSQRLLAEYVDAGSEPAFHELVTRYVDLVYSTAVRLTEGDTHRAEDVTQTVFADLARLARSLSGNVMLGGWLHRHTCYVAATMLRGERRRQSRERQAAEMNALQDNTEINRAHIAPVLDEAINELGEEDRTAILLRFFERHDFRAIGQTLGSTEDAAQKRVSRALDKLQGILRHRGVTLSVAALGTALAGGVVTAAPAGLAVSICGAAVIGVAGTGSAFTIFNLMTMTKLKLGIIGAVAAVAVTTPLVLQHQALERSREEALALREQVGAQKAENERLTGLLARQGNSQSENERMSELLRLRSAVTELRKQTNELAALKEQNRQLQAALQQIPSTTDSAQVSPQRSDFPREQWAYAGYETPEAAALTMAWAAANGDVGVITNSTTPELQQMLDFLVRQGRFETEFLAGMKADVQGMSEFRIAKREVLTNDLIKLTVSIPGKNDRHPILKKIGNEWKFVRFN